MTHSLRLGCIQSEDFKVFWSRKKPTYEEQRAYLIQAIRDFIDGTGGEWDWDDFTSCPTSYPELDAVRGFCLGLRNSYPPSKRTEWCNSDGMGELRRRLEELETEQISH